MTRIMLRFLLVLVGEGLLLLTSGETTVSVSAESIASTEFSQTYASDLEIHSIPNDSKFPVEDDMFSTEANRGYETTGGPAIPPQSVSQTSKDPTAKIPMEPPTTSPDEQKPMSTDAPSTKVGAKEESRATEIQTETFAPDSQTATPEAEEIVGNTEHSSEMASSGNETRVSTDSKNLLQNQGKSEKTTTLSPKSATRKRSVELTVPDEGTTSPNTEVTVSQETHSSLVITGPENSESSEESTEIIRNSDNSSATGTSTPHHSEELEREVSPENSSPVIGEHESEILMMSGSENIKTMSEHEDQRSQTFLVSPKVVVMSHQFDVLNGGGATMMPIDNDNYPNNLGFENKEAMGVTFDPDGMRHDGPQDPDSIVFSVSDQYREMEPLKHFPVDAKESEIHIATESNSDEGKITLNETRKFENLEHIHEDASVFLSSQSSTSPDSVEKDEVTLPEFQIHNYTSRISDESEEMLQDAPQLPGINMLPDFAQIKPDESATISKKEEVGQRPSDSSTRKAIPTEEWKKELESSTPKSEVGSGSQLPDQSVIRPVKIKISSPSEEYVSALPGSLSTQSGESSPVPSPSVPTTGSKTTDKVVESSSLDSSSPTIILPEPASEKVAGNVAVSTTPPELVDSVNAGSLNETSNSTIAGIAVKTSVSVSLPLSNSNNGSVGQQSTNENSSSSIPFISTNLPSAVKDSNDTSFSPPTEGLTSTTPPATTTETASTGFKIRKPKLKIGGDETRTRPPYVPRRPAGATTEAGPPVSIFKKTRTRIASITSSTTARPFRPYSTVRIHYATHHGMAIVPPAEEWLVSTEPVTTTTEPTTTTTEEPIEEEPFTDQTVMPIISDEGEVTLVKVAGYIALDRGIRWHELLDNRQTPEYKENAQRVLLHLERLFRSSSIAPRLWKIEIDGFSGSRSSRPVGVDFFLYMIKSTPVDPDHLRSIFGEKLTPNRTFGTFRVDNTKTAFEVLQEEPLIKATPPPDDDDEGAEPPIPQWAIACIVIGAASLIFIVLFAAVTLYGRHHMRRRYSSKLSEEGERSSGEWESKMAAAYENMAADTLYDADENTYKKQTAGRIATFHGIPSPLKRCDSWSSDGRRPPRWTSHFQ